MTWSSIKFQQNVIQQNDNQQNCVLKNEILKKMKIWKTVLLIVTAMSVVRLNVVAPIGKELKLNERAFNIQLSFQELTTQWAIFIIEAAPE
jgi:hypothetical protein